MRRAAFLAAAMAATAVLPAGATSDCATGSFVGGGSRSVPVPAGEYELTVETWDRYDGRRYATVDQWSESVTVAGRTTPDLADGVDSADWSDRWRWTSTGTLVVAHAWPGSGPHSVSWRVCWDAVTTETTVPSVVSVPAEVTTTTAPSLTSTTVPVETSSTVELPAAGVAAAVLEQPSYTG